MKKLFSSVIALAFAFCANAQGDSQNVVYEEDFNSLVAVTQDVCGYSKDMAANSTTLYGAQPVEGWTVSSGVGVADSGTEGNAVVGGIFAYGSTALMRGGNVGAPATDPAGNAGNAFGALAVWGNKVQYTKDIELEAGVYSVTIPTFNAKGTANVTNLTGVIVDGTNNYSTVKSFTENDWTTQTIEVALPVKSTVTISLGYVSLGSGSGDNPHLFFDKITIIQTADPAAALKEYKDNAIAKIDALPVGNGLFLYTQESVDAAKVAVNAATNSEEVDAVVMPSAAQPKADAEYIIKNLSGEVYLSVNAEKNVFLGAEETKFTFETAEGGFYLKSGEFYVGLAGSNTWSMSSAADKKAVITVNPVLKDGAYVYSLGNKNGLIGSDNAGAGSGCYANKKIENNGLWTITEFVVVPTEVTFVVDNADKVRVINEDFSQLDLENEEDNMLDPGQYVISSADADYTLYSVSMNGEALVAVNGKFTIDAKAGDKVEIKADYPEKNSDIEFTGAEAIKSIVHSGNKTVTEVSGTVSVKNGYKMTITLDTEKFTVNSVSVNGNEIAGKDGVYTCVVTAKTTVAIDAKAVEPQVTERVLPVPASQPLNLEGADQYFYNVEFGGFFTGANDWGTRASVSREKGMVIPVTAVEGGTYKMASVSPDGELGVWIDGARDGNDKFGFVALKDNKFQITCTKFEGKYLTWGGDEANTRVNFTAEKTNGTWISVSKEEYENFLPQLPKVVLYNKAQQLAALLENAKAVNADVATEQAVYDNIDATVEEINAAIASVQDKLTPVVPVLASLKDYVDNATVLVLNKGTEYIYGSTEQNIAIGDAAQAIASTNNVNGYILEHIEKGDIYLLRSVKDGNNVTIFGKTVTYLNAQPSTTGVTFNLGKDQDGKDGSSWYIKEVEGGYTIQNVGNGAYLNGAGLSAEPVVWGISTFESVSEVVVGISTIESDAAKSGKFVENGKIVIVKNGVKYNVAGQTIK